ncbi:DNA mismatch repair protein MutS [Candidatus Gracilibacteria bacterium]|nr:DNA mismatch repair protein MutS [Candidatus Gracilibacteria bacterium]
MSGKITPMMAQFYEIKKQFPDCIIFFRLGDFYEMFGDDAVLAAQVLDITLTSRDKGENPLPMCGVPYHSAEGYVERLVHRGLKVAICEQVSNPALPGIVKREVVRVVTPATTVSNFDRADFGSRPVLALVADRKVANLISAYANISSPEVLVEAVAISALPDLFMKIQPAEVLLSEALKEHPLINRLVTEFGVLVSVVTELNGAGELVAEHFGLSSLAGLGLDENESLASQAVAQVLAYFRKTQLTDPKFINQIRRLFASDYLVVDATTIANLELYRTQREGALNGSLFRELDLCLTRAGSSKLAEWLVYPLAKKEAILFRQSLVADFYANQGLLRDMTPLLKDLPDLRRVVARLGLAVAGPRDLGAVLAVLVKLPAIVGLLRGVSANMDQFLAKISPLPSLAALLQSALREELPNALGSEQGFVADGYSAQIDEIRKTRANSQAILANFLDVEKERTGISNLKLAYNKVVGYYLEISRGRVDLVPDDYILKQTLTNYNRYITPEIKAFEEKMLAYANDLAGLEAEIFTDLVAKIMASATELQQNAEVLAQLDVLACLAKLALERGYVRPEITEGKEIVIEAGRHPVVETRLAAQTFTANDLELNSAKTTVVLTGPNMGGKSTYLRQNAIIVLLAHMGSFVPAKSAKVPICDRIFTRVGASDNLAKGQSTFMVEMQELAVILHQATDRSLLIIDEVGRGTSTYDGVSIAWSTLEYLHDRVGAFTLFATHFHELIAVADGLKKAANYSMAVSEVDGEVLFLHKVKPGGIADSYGIEVAKLAGLPASLIEAAEVKLKDLEAKSLILHSDRRLSNSTRVPRGLGKNQAQNQLAIFADSAENI